MPTLCTAFRRLVFLSLIALGGSFAPQAAVATGDFPSRVVRIVVPFAPGASTDLVARLLGQKLSVEWGLEAQGGTPDAFGKVITAEAERIRALVAANKLQVE